MNDLTLHKNFTLHVYRDAGEDQRVRSTTMNMLDMPTAQELSAVMDTLKLPKDGYAKVTALGDWKALSGNRQVLYRAYRIDVVGDDRDIENVVLYQNNRNVTGRYLLPYVAVHLDSDWNDAEVLREAVDAILWRWGVDAASGFDIDFTTRHDVGEDIKHIDRLLSRHEYPFGAGARSVRYDRRNNAIIAELTSDKEAKDVAYPRL